MGNFGFIKKGWFSSNSKFLILCVMMFLTVYIHSLLKIAKDAVIVPNLGAECISAIKMWVVLPFSMVFMIIYMKLSDIFSRSRLLYVMNWFFISFFIVFCLFLYPNAKALALDFTGSNLKNLPVFNYLLPVLSNWHYSLFYFLSELWVTVMLSISLWSVANHITSIDESKKVYPILGIVAQFGLMTASQLARLFSSHEGSWQNTLNKNTISIVIAGILLTVCFYLITKTIGEEAFNGKQSLGIQKKKKEKISILESLKLIVTSKPILMIVSLLLCYNISINLVEGVWKKSIEVLMMRDANKIQHFMGTVSFWVSLFSILFSLVGIYILRVYKWITVALVTPLMFSFFGIIFFICAVFRNELSFLGTLGFSAISIAVYSGATLVTAARSTKFTLFDSTKEMAYIPLDDMLKTKGKAAAETIGMRFGKGTGALLQQVLLGLGGAGTTLLDLAPIIAVLFAGMMVWWIYATCSLGKLMKK